MSRESALAKARDLRVALLDHGVPAVSIELQIGRPVIGDDYDSLDIKTNFAHHIVSRYSESNKTPGLHVIKNGRTGLPGPLANGYGGFDLIYRIITFGYANHPGAGGPINVGGFMIPKDSARRYAWGTEWEGGLSLADWDRVYTNPSTGKKMTFREFMGRAHGGIQDYFNLPASSHLEHSTWAPTRKIDRLGYNQSEGISEIRKYAAISQPPPVPQPPPGDTRPRNSKGQLSMSYDALYTALDQEVSHTYQAYVDSAMASMQRIGFGTEFGDKTNYTQHEFRTTFYKMAFAIRASAIAYAFEWFVDRVGFWPPDFNDWPENAKDR
jgi:hypothetical protein